MNACQLLQNESMLVLLPRRKWSDCPYQMLCSRQCWCCCLGPWRFKYSVFKTKQLTTLTDHFGHVHFLFFCWLSHSTVILPEQQIACFRRRFVINWRCLCMLRSTVPQYISICKELFCIKKKKKLRATMSNFSLPIDRNALIKSAQPEPIWKWTFVSLPWNFQRF